jgi:hypothetical protein
MPMPQVAWGVWVFFTCTLKTSAPLLKHFPKKWIAFRLPLVVNAFGHLSAFLPPTFQQHFLLGDFRIMPSFPFSYPLACHQPLFFTATSELHCLSCFLVCCQPPFFTATSDSPAITREGSGPPHCPSVMAWRAGGSHRIDIIRCANMFHLW